MLKYKYPMLWACAKEICRIKKEGHQFVGIRDLRKFVKENKELLPEVVEGMKVVL